MIKRLFLFVMLCLFVSSGFCQKKDFNAALMNSRQPGKGYRLNYKFKLNIPASAKDRMNKYKKYMTKNDYIMIHEELYYSSNYATEWKYFDFIPKSEYVQYIMENLNGGKSLEELANTGTAYIYKTGDNGPLFIVDSVMWSGQVKNGKIQGEGFGMAKVNDHEYCKIKGIFVDGLLQGVGEFVYYHESDYGRYDNSKLKRYSIEMGAYADGMAWIKIKDKYGYLSSDYKIAIPLLYDGASDFANGIAIVKTGNTDTKINKRGETLGLADNTQFTYKQAVEMKKTQPHLAKQMEDWVSNFIDQSSSYNDLVGIEKDFPTLADKADKRKKEIYQIDCKQLKDLLEEAKQKSSGNEFAKAGKKVYAENFVSTYTKHNYDPANMMPLAKELARYYKVWKKLEDFERTKFVEYDESLLEAIVTIGKYNTKPIFHDDWALKEEKEIKNAQEICQDPGVFGLDNFYKKAYDRLVERYKNFEKNYEKSSEEYHEAVRKRNAEIAASSEYREKIEKKAASTKIPHYKLSGWEKTPFLNTINCPEFAIVEFDDYETGIIGRYKNGTYKANSSNKDYKTLYDAIAAEYIYKKFGVVRKEGLE